MIYAAKLGTSIAYGDSLHSSENVATPARHLPALTSPQLLIKLVQSLPVIALLYSPSTAHIVASSKKAKATFALPDNVYGLFAESSTKAQIQAHEANGYDIEEIEVPLEDRQECATVSLQHIVAPSTHMVLLCLINFREAGKEDVEMNRMTPRELDIVDLLLKGENTEQMANSTGLTVGTVRNHIHKICEKLKVKNRVQAIIKLKK